MGNYCDVVFCVQRAGKIFNKSVRDAMGDYGVTIAILAFTGVAFAFKRHGDTAVPTLAIPSEFAPTWVNPATGKARGWFVNPLGINKDPLRSSTKPREVTTTILAPDVDGDICLERITD